MQDLFTAPPEAPLAERMRPQSLDDVLGQQHLIGEGKPLRVALEGGVPHSMLLWGSPGIGKTTLARIIARGFDAQFLPISAVFSGVKEIREAVMKAELAWQQGRRTILFVDEVHRFNKSQQDAFLPHVENGLITFIGATTENPSFEVNSALLSRAQVYTLKPLSADDLAKLADKVFRLPENQGVKLAAEACTLLVQAADGDARRLLNLLEQLLQAAKTSGLNDIGAEFAAQSLGTQLRRFDKGGDQFYNQMRAFVRETGSTEVPVHLCNAPTKLMKELGYGRDYRYAHNEPYAYAAGETYMPEGLDEPDFYRPVPRGLEVKIAEKLAWLKSLDEAAEEGA